MAWRSALGRPFGQVDHARHGGAWLQQLPAAEQRRIGERLAALPMAFEVETLAGVVGIVHADFPSDDWDDLAAIDWRTLDRMDSATRARSASLRSAVRVHRIPAT